MKKEWKWFSIFNYEKEEAYLRAQHKRGWKFVKVTGFGTYHFVECQPEDVVYQLDYNQEGSANKDQYIKMFSDCGWEYLQEYAGYTYFRKPVGETEESIFCDESSKLAMLERVYKGRLVPLLVIFSACLLPQFVLNLANGNYFLAGLMGAILAIYGAFFGYSAFHYYRKKNKGGE